MKSARIPSLGEAYEVAERCVSSYARSAGEREDLVQDVLLGLVGAIRRNGRPASLAALTAVIARRVTAQHLRNRYRRPATVELPSDLRDPATGTPLDSAITRERLRRVREGLTASPARHRRAFDLFVLRGMSAERVAGILGTRPATVRVWVHRARRRIE